MSPEEKRIAIAEACGWRKWRFGDPFSEGLRLADKKFGGYVRCVTRVYPNGVTLNVDESPLYSFKTIERDYLPVNFWLNSLGQWRKTIPDYFNDLNAMHEAEKTLTDDQYVTFNNTLADMCEREQDGVYPTRMVSATAAQRAEAFLITIGKIKP